MRLDLFLSEHLAEQDAAFELSRTMFQKLIALGKVLLDGKTPKASMKLRGGEWIMITLPEPVPLMVQPESMDLDIIYEDADVIAVNKSAGLVVHPGAGHPSGTLVNGLLEHCKDLSGIGGVMRPGIVHRLDRGTSGVMIVAKHDKAHESLAHQFADRSVEKVYTAFVLGIPIKTKGSIDTFYGRHASDRKRFSSRVTSGRRAITHYRLIRSHLGLSEVEVRLETGRTHQIRVHFSDVGHPCVGDPIYGARQWRDLKGKVRQGVRALERQALHASRLCVKHPVTGVTLTLEAPLPSDMAALRAAMCP